MHIDIITCLPELILPYLGQSILARAQKKRKVSIQVHNLRAYAPPHGQVDAPPYGGGGGMVLKVAPIAKCIRELQAQRQYDELIYLTPDGEPFQQSTANYLSLKKNLLFLAGHYKGIDERARQLFITKEISIGDYVLTGGELAALVVIDAIIRLIPGVISDASSALEDSFQDGLLAPPLYTRPAVFEGLEVPEVLRSGNLAKIQEWRLKQAQEKTRRRRPDIYKRYLQIFGD